MLSSGPPDIRTCRRTPKSHLCRLKARSRQMNWTELTWTCWPSYTTRYWSGASASQSWLAAVCEVRKCWSLRTGVELRVEFSSPAVNTSLQRKGLEAMSVRTTFDEEALTVARLKGQSHETGWPLQSTLNNNNTKEEKKMLIMYHFKTRFVCSSY